jgi:hypothetical protein
VNVERRLGEVERRILLTQERLDVRQDFADGVLAGAAWRVSARNVDAIAAGIEWRPSREMIVPEWRGLGYGREKFF